MEISKDILDKANVIVDDEQLNGVTGGTEVCEYNGPITDPRLVKFRYEIGQQVYAFSSTGEFKCTILEKKIFDVGPYYYPAYKVRVIDTGKELNVAENAIFPWSIQ